MFDKDEVGRSKKYTLTSVIERLKLIITTVFKIHAWHSEINNTIKTYAAYGLKWLFTLEVPLY